MRYTINLNSDINYKWAYNTNIHMEIKELTMLSKLYDFFIKKTTYVYDTQLKNLQFNDNVKYTYKDNDITDLLKNHINLILEYSETVEKLQNFLDTYLTHNEIITDSNLRKILL